jgi:hypothetical protein
MSSGRTEGQPQSFCSEHHRRGYSASGRHERRSIAMILEPGTARLSRDWVTGPKRRTPGKRARRLSRGSIFRPQNAPGPDAVDRYVREQTHLVWTQLIGTSENERTWSGRSGSVHQRTNAPALDAVDRHVRAQANLAGNAVDRFVRACSGRSGSVRQRTNQPGLDRVDMCGA